MKITYRKAILTIAIACLLGGVLPSSATAGEKGYRYWGYFQAVPGATSWTMAMTGPTVNVPDGSVEGWAFTFSSNSVPDAAPPRITPNFAKICGRTKLTDTNQKRVGVIVDFGRAVLRPKGETTPHLVSKCVVIDKNAIGSEILSKVVKLRMHSSGFVCGINNYPAKECGAEVPTPSSLIIKK